MKNLISVILCVILILPCGFTQDYFEVDSIASSFSSRGQTVKKLSRTIDNSFKDDFEKVRAIYTWIGLNIKYDDVEFGRYNYTYTDDQERLRKEIKQTKKLSKYVISRRKAVCEGYAALFHELCTAIGLESRIVQGNAKTHASQIGNSKRNNHAWNMLTINNTKYLFDVTWDAVSESKPYITYRYFMIDPEILIKNHFPKNPIDQLISEPISQETYSNWPLFHLTPTFYEFEILEPTQGSLLKNEDIHFKLEMSGETQLSSISYKIGKHYAQVTNFHFDGEKNIYFVLEKEKLINSKLTIFINSSPIASYKVR